jgi:hypothetical protein
MAVSMREKPPTPLPEPTSTAGNGPLPAGLRTPTGT